MTFAEEVKRLRESAGLSQVALAKAVGVGQSFVSMMEKGERPSVGAEVLFRLSRALGVKCEHFEEFLAPQVEPSAPEPEPAPKKPGRKGKK